MRVLYLIDTLSNGGAERSTLEIVRQFRRTDAVVCHLYPGNTLVPEFEGADIPVVSLDLPGRYALKMAAERVSDLVERYQPDLMHATLFRSRLTARTVGLFKRVPVVETFVSDDYGTARMKTLPRASQLKVALIQLTDRASASVAAQLVANSRSVKDAICRSLGVAESRVEVIYRGRIPERFAASPQARSQTRRELGIPESAPVVVSVGRLLAQKGHDDLIRAFSSVATHEPEARLIIAGDGPEKPVLLQLIETLRLHDHVHLLGDHNDVPALLNSSDVFALMTHVEGNPGAIIEAMLSELPIVASDISAIRECIVNDESGLLTARGDVRATARSILGLIRDPALARSLGQSARKVATERFDVSSIAAQHEDLYDRLSDA